MNALMQDLKFGLRTLRKSPGFTLIAVSMLALGIGACSAAFSLVDAVLFKPLPYPRVEEMVRLLEQHQDGGTNRTSALTYLDWAKESSSFSALAAVADGTVALTANGGAEQLSGLRVTAQYFEVFGVHAAMGRTFTAEEDQLGREQVAVISHALWRAKFGADPAVLEKTYLFDGRPHHIIGVLPPGPFDRGTAQIWRPLAFAPGHLTRNYHWLSGWGRLKPGVTLEATRREMAAIGARIAREDPDTNAQVGVAVDPYASLRVRPQFRQSLYLLLAAVGAVLLIACFNLANLTLARGLDRERELAIRLSLGAGRGRLLRQLLTESALLTLGGSLMGAALGYALMRLVVNLVPPAFLPAETVVTMDGRVLLATLGLGLFSGLLVGVLPAFRVARRDLVFSLQVSGAGATTSRPRQRLRASLIVSEVALAFMLLAGAGLLLRSFQKLSAVEIGPEPANVITAVVPIPELRYTSADAFNAYLRRLTAGIGALPGVRAVALTSAVPMRSSYGMGFGIVGQPPVASVDRPWCYFKTVSPAYFPTVGMNLRRGRQLEARDTRGAPLVAVINEEMARRYFSHEEPVGKRLLIPEIVLGKTGLGADQAWEIVGIVADEKIGPLAEEDDAPCVYVNTEQSPQVNQSLVVRTAADPILVQRAIAKTVYEIDPTQSLAYVMTLAAAKTDAMVDHRFSAWLLGIFAIVAVLLSSIGLYGLLAYAVRQRRRELGVRAALGATPANLLRLVVANGMRLVGLGLAGGLAGTLVGARVLSSLLFGVSEKDPVTLAVVAAILALVALLACALPAWRAAQADPMTALKCD